MILDRIGDKWTVLTLELLSKSPLRFNEIRRKIDGVSPKVLSQTLKAMERDGLVRREAYATVPVTVEYSITELGGSLAAAVGQLVEWALANADGVLASRAAYDQASADY